MTPAGKDFLSSATEIIQMADNAVLQAKRVDCGMVGHISVGILCGLYTDTFPAAVKRFKDKYPCLDVELQPVNMNTMKTRLSQGMLDIALTRRLSGEEFNGNLDFRVLFKDRFKLALHRDHPLADRGSIELAELKDDPFVFLSETASTSTYRYTLELCAGEGSHPASIISRPRLNRCVPCCEPAWAVLLFQSAARHMVRMISFFYRLTGRTQSQMSCLSGNARMQTH
jgi:DNA-binding transcriptional LysR family regulator